MPLFLPHEPSGLDPVTQNRLDDIITALQTWAGQIEGFGKWVNVPYDAGNYGANLGIWTVEQADYVSYRYTVIGSTMIMEVTVVSSSTDANIDSGLTVRLPVGYQVDISQGVNVVNTNWVAGHAHYYVSGGISGTGIVKPAWDGGYSALNDKRGILGIFRDLNETGWTSGISNALEIGMMAIFPVIKV